MAKIAEEKFSGEPRVRVICADVEEYPFDRKFDRIVVYNAFPHFPYPKRLVKILAGLLKEDGRLTVAHGMSREAIDGHHSGAASKVSNGLMAAESLKRIFDAHFEVEVVISNRHMYQVSGVKRDVLAHSHSGHTHSHGGLTHCHTHGEEAHDHLPKDNATPLEELLVMMKYLVSHNDAHAQEVADLARELMVAGKDVAYDEIMDAVSDFDMVNAKLAAILSNLSIQQDD
jgi:SAM-dependent methyltransferase